MKPFYYLSLFLVLGNFQSSQSSKKESEIPAIEKLLIKAENLLSANKNEEIHEIDNKIMHYLRYADDKNRIRYYQFKGSFEQKKNNFSASLEYFKKALDLTQPENELNLAISYHGISLYYKHLNDTDNEEKFLLKSYEYANSINNKTWIIHSGTGLLNLYNDIDDEKKVAFYINKMQLLGGSHTAVLLAIANIHLKNQEFQDGMKIIWDVILSDPDFNNKETMYALINVIGIHMDMGDYDKAKQIIDIGLLNPEKYDPLVVSFYRFFNGLIYHKTGNFSEARKEYTTALKLSNDMGLQESVLEYFFQLDSSRWTPDYLSSKIDEKLFSTYLVNTPTAAIIEQIVAYRSFSSSVQKQKVIDQALLYIQSHPEIHKSKSLLLLREFTKDQDITYRRPEVEKIINLLEKDESERVNTLMKNYLSINNDVFERRLSDNKKLLDEKEFIIHQEKIRTNNVIKVIFVIIGILFIISYVLFKIYNDAKKIRRLNASITAKSEKLEQYYEEYESLLMILGHQVKKPINQLHYSFEGIIEKTKHFNDEDLNFVLGVIKNDTAELSNRIKMILTLIKHRLENSSISITKVNLGELIMERLVYFETHFRESNIQFKINIAETVCTQSNKESLSIILDNLFENIKKYGLPGEKIELRVAETRAGIILEIINKFSQSIHQLESRKNTKSGLAPSFGLGHKIIQRLCSMLKIEYQFSKTKNLYSTKLVFSS